jgi:hypothetical protein
MSFFRSGTPVILKESNHAQAQLNELESLRDVVPLSMKRNLEDDIRNLRAGIGGENKVLYELRNSHMDMFVIQDLVLEHAGNSAQIDFLVLTQRRFFVIECKNLYGNITIDDKGNFIRELSGQRREGFYSPVAQNRRHIDLIQAMKREDRSMIINMLVDRDFSDIYRSLVVLANPKTILNDARAPKEVREQVVRADHLVDRIRAINNERGPGRDKAPLSVVEKSAHWFLEHDKDCGGADFAAKYRAALESPRQEPPMIPQTPTPGYQIGTPTCPKCGAPMVLRTAKKGKRAGKQFWGCSAYPKCRSIINID